MFGLYFTRVVPRSYAEVMAADKTSFNTFFHAMLERGVYFAPSAYEAGSCRPHIRRASLLKRSRRRIAVFSSLPKQ